MKRFFKSQTAKSFLIFWVAILGALLIYAIPLVHDLQNKSIDLIFEYRGPVSPPDTQVVIVALDDESLRSLNRKYPFPTQYYTHLVKNLDRAGAKLIVMDIEFTEPNFEHPERDLEFAQAINDAGNVILAGKVVYELASGRVYNPQILPPIAPLIRSDAAWGIVNAIEDRDGFIRRYLLFDYVGEKIYYSLSIKALEKLSEPIVPQDPFDPVFIVGDHRIPKAQANSMYINYRGPKGTFRTYSFASVLDDSTFQLLPDEDTDIFEFHLEWETFKDKIVMVGASAEELQDNKFTPFFNYRGQSQKIPGVEIHANALSTILQDDFLSALPPFLVLLYVLLIGALTSVLTFSLRPFKSLFVSIAMVLFCIGLAFFMFTHFSLFFPMILPSMVIAFTFVGNTMIKIVAEQREKLRIRQTFQQYVAPSIVHKMLSSGELPAYGGERKELTILFSDIRQFTKFSESHEPEFVVSRLSNYLSNMVEIIFRHRGTLDKFVGDEIMALFGAPYYFDNHAELACQTALEMIEKLSMLSKEWSSTNGQFMKIGIGINTGKVLVGNLGSSQLFDYTVIGDQVNLGARLEGANKIYQTSIILSENTYNQVSKNALVRELDRVRVVGRMTPIRIYELLGMHSLPQLEKDYKIKVFEEGLEAYRQMRWADALKLFRKVLKVFPNDGPSQVFIIRCLNYLEHSPDPDWDGVYDFVQK